MNILNKKTNEKTKECQNKLNKLKKKLMSEQTKQIEKEINVIQLQL